ncbi:pilus assembly protein HofM, partial [Escherichia coli]|nr:pilus assembly protein HofM [Escherichia coli]
TSELATLAELQQQLLPQGINIRLCDNRENALSAGAEPFSPFDLFHYKQPPMPEYASDFTLAAGLALRAEDR